MGVRCNSVGGGGADGLHARCSRSGGFILRPGSSGGMYDLSKFSGALTAVCLCFVSSGTSDEL